MKPVVDGLKAKYAGRYDIRVMDTTSDPAARQLEQTYDVLGYPTFVFVNSDGTQSGIVVGAVPVAQLEAELAKLK